MRPSEIWIKHQIVSRRNLVEAVKFEPRLARTYNNRGSAYYQSGRINRAIKDYDRAIQLSPELAEFYANRAYAYELISRDSDAQRDFALATSLGFKPLSRTKTKNIRRGEDIRAWEESQTG